jgi:hypothetical protein
MRRLIFASYLLLIRIEILMLFTDLSSLHDLVRRRLVRNIPEKQGIPSREELCHAMDLACVFYPKRVMCLQRSAATTLLLRRYGKKAEMVIGAQFLPFKAHAWVEIDGAVVNDKPYILEVYRPLERC